MTLSEIGLKKYNWSKIEVLLVKTMSGISNLAFDPSERGENVSVYLFYLGT